MHQRLRDDYGVSGSESSLRRYLKATFTEEIVRERVVVLGDTPPPGEEAQVDYGLLGRWFDPVTQRVRRVWGFLMVMCFSRMLLLGPVLTMDERAWVECHVLALEFFGGAVRGVMPDNLRTGVIKADLYDPLINKAFGEFAAHDGTLVDPTRSGAQCAVAEVGHPPRPAEQACVGPATHSGGHGWRSSGVGSGSITVSVSTP